VTTRPCPVCGAEGATPAFERDGWPLAECHRCTALFVATDPASIDFDALYGEAYYRGGSDAVFTDYVGQENARRAQARRKLWALRHLPPRLPSRGRLLDVGCAAGFFLAEARRHYEVQGVELSAWSSAFARERLGLPVFTGTLPRRPCLRRLSTSSRCGTSSSMCPTRWPLLAEAARVLAPGGRAGADHRRLGQCLRASQGADWHLLTPPWHLSFFAAARWRARRHAPGCGCCIWPARAWPATAPFWRHPFGRLAGRLLDRGDILRMPR
jgi:SAM-dependent methyltransferase